MYPESIAYHSHCNALDTVPTSLSLYHLEVYPRSLCIQSYISYELQKYHWYLDPKKLILKPKSMGFPTFMLVNFFVQILIMCQKFVFVFLIKINFKRKVLMPCPFTGPKMFWARPNFLCQTKNLYTYCGSHKHFVPDKKMICIQ